MHIPGRMMRVMTRLVPRAQAVRMSGRMLGRATRDLADRDPAGAQTQP
jgi:hypothetical protein